MRLVADAGLWSTGPQTAPHPLAAVLEVSGAVLSWTIDEAAGAARITFTDPDRMDWLWRVLGEEGHTAVVEALAGRTPTDVRSVEVADVDPVPGSLEPLRRLAVGHWLRRWWPASRRDGIPDLNPALLDAELALLTVAAQDFFTDDTLDSDAAGLLQPHGETLNVLARQEDPRVLALVRQCIELADDLGLGDWSERPAASEPKRDEYALAAGRGTASRRQPVIESGVASINWSAVPPGIFDAAENTVDWSIDISGPAVVAVVRVALSGPVPATGVSVRLQSGTVTGASPLDASGSAILSLLDGGAPITETAAWNHDWAHTSVVIGSGGGESAETRERVRSFARQRLNPPRSDAFLAEILAAESDY
jgi:hypothetical protein